MVDLIVIGHKMKIEIEEDNFGREKSLDKNVIDKSMDKVEEVDNVGATPFDQYKGHPQVQDSVQAAQDEKEERLKKK